jgi:secondary thiamine-phosphate synthase enzyme
MKVWYSEISFSTRRRSEVLDLTDQILQEVRKSGIRNGLLVVNLPHATACLTLNEGESGVKNDLLRKLDELVPPSGNYEHDRIDDNAHAHLKSSLVGTCRVLPVVEGRVVRGTWQNFLVVEEDGPRTRRLSILLMGE